jgi:hypothetical protein
LVCINISAQSFLLSCQLFKLVPSSALPCYRIIVCPLPCHKVKKNAVITFGIFNYSLSFAPGIYALYLEDDDFRNFSFTYFEQIPGFLVKYLIIEYRVMLRIYMHALETFGLYLN